MSAPSSVVPCQALDDPVKAIHFLEFGAPIDALPSPWGRPAFGWPDPVLTLLPRDDCFNRRERTRAPARRGRSRATLTSGVARADYGRSRSGTLPGALGH